ncbi:MAG: hypothetical protein DHS20C18_04680 [Saprospiraceae bacterium]|nr:MAG: hypothetical protein DHS20C18_04680 [Saprospiraceae bacterium]
MEIKLIILTYNTLTNKQLPIKKVDHFGNPKAIQIAKKAGKWRNPANSKVAKVSIRDYPRGCWRSF